MYQRLQLRQNTLFKKEYLKISTSFIAINKNNRIDLVPIFWETQERAFDVGNKQFNAILANRDPGDFRGQLKMKAVSLNNHRVTLMELRRTGACARFSDGLNTLNRQCLKNVKSMSLYLKKKGITQGYYNSWTIYKTGENAGQENTWRGGLCHTSSDIICFNVCHKEPGQHLLRQWIYWSTTGNGKILWKCISIQIQNI